MLAFGRLAGAYLANGFPHQPLTLHGYVSPHVLRLFGCAGMRSNAIGQTRSESRRLTVLTQDGGLFC